MKLFYVKRDAYATRDTNCFRPQLIVQFTIIICIYKYKDNRRMLQFQSEISKPKSLKYSEVKNP